MNIFIMLKMIEEGLVIYEEGEVKLIKKRLLLNFVLICIMWMFFFIVYLGLQNLELSLNFGVGVYLFVVLMGGGFVFCLLVFVIISYIGCKGVFIILWIILCVYVGVNYYFVGYVFIFGVGIEGLVIGLMWMV